MALPDVTYEYYHGTWGGPLDAEAFAASERAAKASVRRIIGFNAPESDGQAEAYRNAVCAAVDVDAAYGASGGIGEGSGSLTIGSFSIGGGYSGDGANTYDRDMERAVRGELTDSGLLYQGVG